MPNIYRINEGQSKDGRDLMDSMRKLRVAFDVISVEVERIVQAQDTPFGALSVHSDTTSGQLTLNAGHGLVTGQYFNLYFSGGSHRRTNDGI